jgi:hypothetical protein
MKTQTNVKAGYSTSTVLVSRPVIALPSGGPREQSLASYCPE